MIRRATMDDIQPIILLGVPAYYRSAYAERFGNFSTWKAQVELARMIGNPADYLVLVSAPGPGTVDGFIVAGIFEQPFTDTRYVSDVAFVSSGGRGAWLLRRVMKWSREKKLPYIFGNSSGHDGADKLYRAARCERVGGIYMGQ
ncbi:MAG: hypothetical protein ACXWHZ_03550 [Usitatibacter sp.]